MNDVSQWIPQAFKAEVPLMKAPIPNIESTNSSPSTTDQDFAVIDVANMLCSFPVHQPLRHSVPFSSKAHSTLFPGYP